MKFFNNALKSFVEHLSAPQSKLHSCRIRTGSTRQIRNCRSNETLSFEALEPRQLLATFATANGAWTDPGIWSAGVPDASQRAVINQNVTVELDGTEHFAEELVVRGNLVVTEDVGVNKTLETSWVHVNSNGVFSVGSAADRYDEGKFTLTLTGTDVDAMHTIEGVADPVMDNDGFLMTAGGGRVQFFGEDKLSFTKLAATGDIGDTEITVENVIERNFAAGGTDAGGDFITSAQNDGSVNWEIGDQIVIASSSYDYTDEEVRLITDVFNNGTTTTLKFAEPLLNRHYGQIETYSDATDTETATRTYDIDLRAEVALLSRNVKIQGDSNQDTDNSFGDRGRMEVEPRVRSTGLTATEAVSPTQVSNGVGGHLMFMKSSGQITVDGVQLEGLGQASQKGRYPIHWHNGDDKSGDVLRNSSITNSNNRGVTIHGTSGLQIEGVVLHDIHGHGFFFEDAIETDNVLVANIALGIHAVGGNDANSANPGGKDPFVVDTHDSVLETSSRFSSSAAFWITNPDNTFIGNIAAGAGDQRTDDWAGDPGPAGTGFWFAIPRAALGDAMDSGITPIFTQFGQFDNNTSHTTAVGLNFDRGSDIEDAADPSINLGNVQPANEYSPRVGGIKGGNKLSYFVNGFTNYKASDAAFYHRGEGESIKLNDLRVADSYNGPWAVSENIYDNSLFVGNSKGNAETDRIVGGPRLYDGAGLYTGTHFAGFAGDNAFTFQVEGSSFGPTMYHAFSETSFENDGSQANMSHAVSDFTRGPEPDYVFREKHDLGRPAQWSKAALDLDGTLTGGLNGGAGFSIVPNVDFLVDVEGGDVVLSGGKAVLTDDIYARIRVENKDDGNDRFEGDFKNSFNETLLRFTNRDGKVIEATEGQNNGDRSWIQIAAKTDGDGNVDGTFTVEFGREGVPANGFVLNMKNQDGGRPEENQQILNKVNAARIVVKIVGAQNYTPSNTKATFTEVFNDTDLRTATSGVAYLRDAATGDLYLNMGIVDSQDRIDFAPTGGGPLQSTSQSRKVEYGTKIQAEQFDNGIEGIAFHDTDTNGVDATSNAIVNISDGEWLEYTTEIVGNAYNVGITVSSTSAGGKIRVLAGLSNSAGFLRDLGTIEVPDTGGQFQTIWLKNGVDPTSAEGVDLTFAEGPDSVIRIAFENGDAGEDFAGVIFDSFEFAAATQTSSVEGRTIKANFETTTIQLQEFDVGGQGAAYFDDTPEVLDYQSEAFDIAGNDSTKNDETPFRADEDVDANTDGITGKVFAGEWLEYTTDIQAGVYDITLKKIWGGQGNGVKLYVANSNSATEFASPSEISATKFTLLGELLAQSGDNNETITLSDIDLTPWAGSDCVIRIEIVGNWMGLDNLKFVSTTPAVPTVVSATIDEGGVLARPDLWRTLTVEFDQNLTIAGSALSLTNDTLGTPADLSQVGFAYDATDKTATWTFDAANPLPAAFYSYQLSGGAGVSDLAAPFEGQHYVAIPGDVNLDGTVNVLGDAFSLVSNLGNSTGAVWAEGDLNGDGQVNVLGDAFRLVSSLGRDVRVTMTASSSSFRSATAVLTVDDSSDLGAQASSTPLNTSTPPAIEQQQPILAGDQTLRDNVFGSDF